MIDTISCPACGFENKSGHSFCGECGSQIQKQCETCGAFMEMHYKVCGNCGTAFEMLEPAPQEEPVPQRKLQPDTEPAIPPLPKPSVQERKTIARVKAVILIGVLSILLYVRLWIYLSSMTVEDELGTATLAWLTLGAVMTAITLVFGAFRTYHRKGEAAGQAAKELLAFLPGVWRDLDGRERVSAFAIATLGFALMPVVLSFGQGYAAGVDFMLQDAVYWALFYLMTLTLQAWAFSYFEVIPGLVGSIADWLKGVLKGAVGLLVGGIVAFGLALVFSALGSPRYFQVAVQDSANFLRLGLLLLTPALMLATALMFEHFDRKLVQLRYWSHVCEVACERAYEAEEYGKAAVYCGQALKDNPNHENALYFRGWACYYSKHYELALEAFQKLMALQPQDTRLLSDIYNGRGNARRSLGNLKLAIVDYEQAIKLDPNYAAPFTNRGIVHQMQGALELAIADHDEAIAVNPRCSLAYYNKACALALMGNLADACVWLEKAIGLDETYREMARNDSDFDAIRDAPAFQALVDPSE